MHLFKIFQSLMLQDISITNATLQDISIIYAKLQNILITYATLQNFQPLMLHLNIFHPLLLIPVSNTFLFKYIPTRLSSQNAVMMNTIDINLFLTELIKIT